MLNQTPTKLIKTNDSIIPFTGKGIVINETEDYSENSTKDVIEHNRENRNLRKVKSMLY